MKDQDENKLVQISMDGPNVNFKMLQKINEERTANESHHLISIGNCRMHTVHGAFRIGAEATDWRIKKILRGADIVLHDIPARREDIKKSMDLILFLSTSAQPGIYIYLLYIFIYIYI